MPQHASAEFRLKPEAAVDVVATQTIARSGEPWVRLDPVYALSRHRWVRLRYSSNYFDDPVRPIIRCDTSGKRRFVQFMNGPVLGTGEWIGRVPDRATAISISPASRAGPFDFRLVAVETLARRDLIRRGLFYDRSSLLLSLGAKIINAKEERREMLKFAASATPFENYDEWHRRLYRPIDIKGLDRPQSDWRSAPVIRLVMPLDRGGTQELAATLSSLRQQVYQRWALYGLVSDRTPHDVLSLFREQMARDQRLMEVSGDAGIATIVPTPDGHDGFAVAEVGALLPDHALAVLAEMLARQPELCMVYGDEDSVTAKGELHSPLFKPDWSPIFFGGLPYLGRLTCVRVEALMALQLNKVEEFYRHETVLLDRIAKSSANRIGHLRRIVYRRQRELNAEPYPKPPAVFASSRPMQNAGAAAPEVSIVILTRDRADLLAKCVNSLRGLTDYPRYRLIVVDNGSSKADALALLDDLDKSPGCQVLRQPVPFNFSALCNAGARLTSSPMLVFLNNDIVIFDRDWLKALVGFAARPDVGVVGAKLLFPNGTIEHAGVVLGHGSLAGHIYHRQPASEPGYLGQLLVAHEVEAVTAACIAIERAKFEALGGFDESLKVEFNDIDLCLRAAERGWTSVWTPHSMLYHLQSATRGYPLKPYKAFRSERDIFLKRWAHVIRDDRFFHPALSLFSHRPALA
jgi:GT2 family glycosyltransferase